MKLLILFLLSLYGVLLTSWPARGQSAPLNKLILRKKGYAPNAYPPAKSVFNFTVIDPGIALVPVGGGIYMAGWKKWLLLPSKTNLPFATDYCHRDSSLYVFTVNDTKATILKVTGNERQSFKKILEMPLGVYGMRVVSESTIWLWGKQRDKWRVWKYDSAKLLPVFEADLPIADLVALNDKIAVIATNTTIIKLGINHAPEELISMDVPIDGLAAGSDGTLFVSTAKGVLHYLQPDFIEDAEVITYGIHGLLKRYHKSLYVLWREDNQVVEIKL